MKLNLSTLLLLAGIAIAVYGSGISWVPSDIDDVVPTPDVEPAPIVAEGLNILIVEETSARNQLPRKQQEVFTSVRLRKWLDDHDTEFRIWDQDVDSKFDDEKWQDALKVERKSLPWLYASNGKSGFSGPLPESVDAVISKLEEVAK